MRRGLRDKAKRPAPDGDQGALTVSAVTRRIKGLLETEVGRVTVAGEIGSITRARSGHVYLSLKDEHAVLDAVLWRSAAGRLSFDPQEGEKVLARGAITVYEPRGRYQLIVSSLEPAGRGELQQRFEALVKKLREEGLFEPARKQSLPERPRTVGVVTSATGAAVRDIIKVLRRRMPGVRIVLSPCRVQGTGAAAEVVSALERIDRWGRCEVLIVGRGGGSLEDLWAFNEEPVARAIAAARTPVVSAVGHEVDVTIADLVADVRAATPSEAAETVVPDVSVFRRQIASLQRALGQALLGRIREAKARLGALGRAPVLRRPFELVRMRQQLLDETAEALARTLRDQLLAKRNQLELATARLEGLSPLAILTRGYSVTQAEANGRILRSAKEVKPGERIVSRLAQGTIVSEVCETRNED